MLANWLTLSRVPLLVVVLFLLSWPNATARFVAVPAIIVLILLDSLDGMVARARGEASLLGSVLDIAIDRMVEYVLWVIYAYLGLIPVAVPLLVLMRGTSVDAVRSVAPSRGTTPFGMMQTPLGRFLVGSPFMRSSFGIAKVAAFVLLALAHALATATHPWAGTVLAVANVVSWIAVVLCLTRGIPVLVEAPRFLAEPESDSEA